MTLPQFPEFKLVGLEDRDCLTSFITRNPSEACEIHFANIFLWRNFEHPKFSIIHDNLCVLCEPPSEPAYFLQPIGKTRLDETFRVCLSFAPRLSRIPESLAVKYAGKFRCEPDRDNFDYVYRAENLIHLRGKKYDGKRNRIRKFERNHEYRYARLAPEYLEGCRALLDRWLESKTGSVGFIMSAWRDVVREAFGYHERLGLVGGVFEVGGQVAAFALGTRLNPDTAVIPIEIVDPTYDGLSQLVNREFVRREWADCGFINREQDVGNLGLRRAKTSYHPDHLVKKYNIWA
jgi:hypothetical protein